MKIQDAMLEAKEKQEGITRKAWMPDGSVLIPTNTSSCFILADDDPKKKYAIVRWEPQAEDILANDWFVMR